MPCPRRPSADATGFKISQQSFLLQAVEQQPRHKRAEYEPIDGVGSYYELGVRAEIHLKSSLLFSRLRGFASAGAFNFGDAQGLNAPTHDVVAHRLHMHGEKRQ